MKKTVILLCLVLCLTAVLCGCKSPEAPTQETPVSSTQETLENPMQEITDAELIKTYSRGLVLPDGVTKATYYLYNDDIFEMRFESNGISYTARTAVSDSYKDISGMNYKWTIEEDGPILPGKAKRYVGEKETVDVVGWYDGEKGVNYSLSAVAADLDGFDITAVIDQMIAG